MSWFTYTSQTGRSSIHLNSIRKHVKQNVRKVLLWESLRLRHLKQKECIG